MIHIPEISEEKQGTNLMTRKQVMNLFQISKSTLYRWVHKEKYCSHVLKFHIHRSRAQHPTWQPQTKPQT